MKLLTLIKFIKNKYIQDDKKYLMASLYIGMILNFMVEKKTGQVRPIDLDSCKIADNKTFPAKYMTPFSLINNVEGKYNILKEWCTYITLFLLKISH